MKRMRLYGQSVLIVAFAAVGTLLAAQTGDALKIPADFKHWYLVHSTLITKDENKFGLFPGVHLIYVNATGFERLKRGGSTPYPDGTMFADDVRTFSAVEDGSYLEGADRKAFVGDGSDNNWAIWRQHFSSFVPILDFIHALSYVFAAATAGCPSPRSRARPGTPGCTAP